jgi:hypothetical protein
MRAYAQQDRQALPSALEEYERFAFVTFMDLVAISEHLMCRPARARRGSLSR